MRRASAALAGCAFLGTLALAGCYSGEEEYHPYHSGRYSERGVYYEDEDEYTSRRQEWARSHYFYPEHQPWGQPDRPYDWGDGYYDWEPGR